MDFTPAEQKLLSQRQFLEAEIDHFTANAKFKLDESQNEDTTSANDVDDRDVVICVRTRPMLPSEIEKGLFPAITTTPSNAIENQVFVHTLETKFNGTAKLNTKAFGVDYAFGMDATNEQVYEKAAKSLIPIALGGGVGSLFASGQTGSGKTFTMSAIENLVARDLFQFAREYRGGVVAGSVSEQVTSSESFASDFEFRVSFFEILGNKGRDLLQYPNEVFILEDVLGQVQIKGAAEEQVSSPEEFVSVIARGSAFRLTIGTAKNETSSRSHAICRIRIKNLRQPEAEDGILHLLDLAGSESASDSRHHDKDRMQESVEINKSLLTLKECIKNRALAVLSTKHVHVPYRNSKLTILLKSAFELSSIRACKTVVIATLNPNALDTAHSLNTLRYVSPLKVEVPPLTEASSPNDPASWSNAKLRDWVLKTGEAKIDPNVLCPTESGKQLLKLPEAAFIDRCCQCPAVGAKSAKAFYNKFWRLVVLARTEVRREREDRIRQQNEERNKQSVLDEVEFQSRLQSDPAAMARWLESQRYGAEWEKRMELEYASDPVKLQQFKEARLAAKEWRNDMLEKADLKIDQILEEGNGFGLRAIQSVLKKVDNGQELE